MWSKEGLILAGIILLMLTTWLWSVSEIMNECDVTYTEWGKQFKEKYNESN